MFSAGVHGTETAAWPWGQWRDFPHATGHRDWLLVRFLHIWKVPVIHSWQEKSRSVSADSCRGQGRENGGIVSFSCPSVCRHSFKKRPCFLCSYRKLKRAALTSSSTWASAYFQVDKREEVIEGNQKRNTGWWQRDERKDRDGKCTTERDALVSVKEAFCAVSFIKGSLWSLLMVLQVNSCLKYICNVFFGMCNLSFKA